HAATPVDATVVQRALDAAARRVRGMPMPYATTRAAFRHLWLHVDPRVLIPRPETEGLVDRALARLPHGGTVADVGTGSGAIAIALATERHDARVIATDLSPDALAVARLNAAAQRDAHAASIEWRAGDLCAPLAGEALDVLVANPPYVPLASAASLDRGVRDWEPTLALFGGDDGTHVVARLVREAPAVLRPGGWLLVEIDATGGRAALAACEGGTWSSASVEPDLFGRDRYLVARRG
ncbi:MAG: peptide chain release factor N(5)-glutamine methyltransferase, partial [Gemmatimonadaceae bacterium]|nr:peptide chain release factor N(5)-glutamine methyltransferase [Gemmatimonadaceae bacterium]